MAFRILICDDHTILREALGDLLANQFPECEILFAADFVQTCALAEKACPDVALCDLDMPGASPLDGITALQARMAQRPVIVLTGTNDDTLMLRLLAQGVAGFIGKNEGGRVIASALELVLAGGRYLPPRLLALIEQRGAQAQPNAECPVRLTEQQRRVLSLVAQGRPNKVIAQVLGVAPSTIKSHLEHVMRELGVANRLEAVNAARHLGLI